MRSAACGVYENYSLKPYHACRRAEALQSIIQLLGEKELYEVYRDHNKVISIDWTQAKAKRVLEAWQRRMTHHVTHHVTSATNASGDTVRAFSTTSLADILAEFSQVSAVRVGLGYLLMVSSPQLSPLPSVHF